MKKQTMPATPAPIPHNPAHEVTTPTSALHTIVTYCKNKPLSDALSEIELIEALALGNVPPAGMYITGRQRQKLRSHLVALQNLVKATHSIYC